MGPAFYTLDPKVEYQAWVRYSEDDGVVRKSDPVAPRGFTSPLDRPIKDQVAEWNAEEEETARAERRPVNRRFFVVKATTTFEPVEES